MAKNQNGIISVDPRKLGAKVIDVPVTNFLEDNYLQYSYYVIRSRSLIGADGLKPVQRRAIYTMYKLGLTPNANFTKTQQIAGEVSGKYHPHGDSSVAEAMAHLTQKFAMRVPLIDSDGSVGSSTGDRAAAPRYWDCRLSKAGMELLSELKDNVLPMGRNYDDTLDEPGLLPVKWPVTLINGTMGIAVGYKSTIFPSNPQEVINTAIALIKNPELSIDEILKIMPGPDFPTGGELIGTEGIKEMYKTGKGKFTLRGKYTTKALSKGRTEISFYELPYQVSAENIRAKIQALKNDGKLKEVSMFKDLSDKNHLYKFNITLKAGSNATLVLKDLFKLTPLSSSYTSNNNILSDGMPTMANIYKLFKQFIDLRRLCTRNRNKNQKTNLEIELNKNQGLLKVLVDIDRVIEIIRNSENSDNAKKLLCKEFKLNDEQGEYILSLQLRKLTKADRLELDNRNNEIKEQLKNVNSILANPELLDDEIIKDLEATKKIIQSDRRTTILNKNAEEIKAEEKNKQVQAKALEKDSPIVIVKYADNSIFKGLELPSSEITKGLPISSILKGRSNDELFALMSNGIGIRIPNSYIPFQKKTDTSIMGINNTDDFITLGKIDSGKKDCGLLCVTSTGRIATLNGRIPQHSKELSILKLDNDEKIIFAQWITKSDLNKSLSIVSSDGLIAKMPVDCMRVTGYNSQGVKGINLNDNANVVGAVITENKATIVSMTTASIKATKLSDIPMRNRGAKGVVLQRLGKRTGNEIVSVFGGDNLLMSDKLGNKMTIPEISARAASGFKFPTLGLIGGFKIENNNDIDDN